MQRHMLGTQAAGAAGMKAISDLIFAAKDPVSTPVAYEEIGQDLTGAPIEAGLGSFTWTWDVLSQEDYEFLLTVQGDTAGAYVYARTSKHSGDSGIDFANYLAIARRPTFESRNGLLCYQVQIQFVAAEPA